MVIGTVWFVNAVNFLDGLDWMTAVQMVPITLGVAALEALGAVPPPVSACWRSPCSAPRSASPCSTSIRLRIFLGDAGSLPIGLCLAFMLIVVAETDLAAALLLSLYTLADATMTLFRRMLAGERISSAHRTHFYQRAVAQGLSVPQVTARVFLLGVLLAILAVVTVLADSLFIDLVMVGLGLLATGSMLYALAHGR